MLARHHRRRRGADHRQRPFELGPHPLQVVEHRLLATGREDAQEVAAGEHAIGPEREGPHDVVPISIATEARREGGFTDEEIARLIRTTQRSAVY